MTSIDFHSCFEALTKNSPYAWQTDLFDHLRRGDFPPACDVPTGLGKTAVIDTWLLALADALITEQAQRLVPVRLVYVVDRRVIVDQATREAERIVARINEAEDEEKNPLYRVAQALRKAAAFRHKEIIAVSALRGQLEDNRKWCVDPSRPAIIIGTVDMIGSRLLFNGYGNIGRSYRALQAGLLGQDALIVIDEAHLSPTFVTTVKRIQNRVRQFPTFQPFTVMLLSATLNVEEDDEAQCLEGRRKPLTIGEKDRQQAREILQAEKWLEWVEFTRDEESKADKAMYDAEARAIVDWAKEFKDQPVSIVIYGTMVELVKKVYEKLRNELDKEFNERILLMTGGMRGLERDGLFDNEVFKQFLPRPEHLRRTEGKAYYLIATSCAEVGVNLDADHGALDLTTFDSMIQRCGRINRFGNVAAHIKGFVDEEKLRIGKRLIALEDGLTPLQTQIAAADSELTSISERWKSTKDKEQRRTLKDMEAEARQRKAKLVKKKERRATRINQLLEKFRKEHKNERISRFKAACRTYLLLNRHPKTDGAISVNPEALSDMPQDDRTRLAPPVCPPLDEARLDDWSLTSLKQSEFRKPLVEYWLRGVVEDETPETILCWRAELDLLKLPDRAKKEDYEKLQKMAEKMIETIPLAPRECAKETTKRAEEVLKAIAQRHSQKFIVLLRDDECELIQLESFLQKKGKKAAEEPEVEESEEAGEVEERDSKDPLRKLAFATVFIPCSCGGLSRGIADEKNLNIVEDAVKDEWARFLFRQDESANQWTATKLTNGGAIIAQHENLAALVRQLQKQEDKRLLKRFELNFEAVSDDESEEHLGRSVIAYFIERNSPDHLLRDDDAASTSLGEVPLTDHNEQVGKYAGRLAEKLNLPSEIISALFHAGVRHDRGKQREWWQRAVGNNGPTPLAKTGHHYFNNEVNCGYRHEFGSLFDSLSDEELSSLTEIQKELVLHLISAHHGYARPHFPKRAFDREQPDQLNLELVKDVMVRFERLQKHFGWWQLAYLEAVLKAADALASSGAKENE